MLILNTVCLFWWFTIVSSFFLGCKNVQNHSLLSFPFLLPFPLLICFSFYFLGFFHFELSEMPNVPKYMIPY